MIIDFVTLYGNNWWIILSEKRLFGIYFNPGDNKDVILKLLEGVNAKEFPKVKQVIFGGKITYEFDH